MIHFKAGFMDTNIQKQDKLITRIVEIINESMEPKRIWLFGSRAEGTYDQHSDFDIAVEGHPSDIRTFRKTREKLDAVLGIYSIDLVELEKVNQPFRELIQRKGVILYERD